MLTATWFSVEAIAAASTFDVKFHSLRDELHHLRKSSAALDKEKVKAEAELRHIIKKTVRRHIIRRKIHRALCRVGKVFGKSCYKPREFNSAGVSPSTAPNGRGVGHRVGRPPVWIEEQQVHHGCHGKKHNVPEKLKKAIKRVRSVNEKLVAFEKGFISEEGIKDREWYKHLGVAPGKWLGKSHLHTFSDIKLTMLKATVRPPSRP